MAQSQYQRHAHFQNEDTDSGDESSPGLQFQSRRLRSNTIRHSKPTPDVDNAIVSNDPGGGIRLIPSKPVPIVGASHLMLDLEPNHQAARPGHTDESHGSSPPEDKGKVLPPSIGNPSDTSRRPEVRMNSTPASVSMPLMLQKSDNSNADESASLPRSQRSTNSPGASRSSDRQRILSEKVQQGIPTSQAANTQNNSENSSEAAKEKPVAPKDRSDPSAGRTASRTPEWLNVLYNKVKASRRTSWIVPTVTDYNLMKPVIRSSVSAWLGLVFLLIQPILRVEGQSAFFSVVVAFIAPPNLPFIQAMEQIVYLWVFVGLAWVWVIICAACISAVRTNYVNPAFLAQVENKYSGLKATNPEQYQRRIVSARHGYSLG
jgi:hypothetical protein